MLMRTWNYRGFAIKPVLASLEQIFDQKRVFFLKKWFFGLCDKSADSADTDEKMLGNVVYNTFSTDSII